MAETDISAQWDRFISDSPAGQGELESARDELEWRLKQDMDAERYVVDDEDFRSDI